MRKPQFRSAFSLHAFIVLFVLVSTSAVSSHLFAHDKAGTQDELNNDIDFGFLFFNVLQQEPLQAGIALRRIKENWHDGLVPMALEVLLFTRPGGIHDELIALIKESTGDKSSREIQDLYYSTWNTDITPVKGYSDFKADLYLNIDPKFETYFRGRQDSARIRLDEIRWGGVHQDGIPPLRDPEMIKASEATYLEDDNIVFGIEINGDARAYPKRILAWHEMFTDTIGGVDIAGVYCTLCGTVIPYKTDHKGTKYKLGTSGFLYRSNKLMYDKATQSLWSTTRGTPVVGPLVDKGIELEYESVVTTTWGEWRKRHPDTSVLSLETGHRRDYGEGVAYADYFGTDELMFNTPFKDDRLDNKREILALRFAAAPDQQLAIDTDFLSRNEIYKGKIGQQNFIVLTDRTGANRVYDPKDVNLQEYDRNQQALDDKGVAWQMHEEWLQAPDGTRLPRLPYHRAFWFGWRAAFPETQLIM